MSSQVRIPRSPQAGQPETLLSYTGMVRASRALDRGSSVLRAEPLGDRRASGRGGIRGNPLCYLRKHGQTKVPRKPNPSLLRAY